MSTTTTRPALNSPGRAGSRKVLFMEDIVTSPPARLVLGVFRLVIGFYFLWPFIDKVFGLGYSTPAARAWINGGSPTTGFLSNVKGPFASLFKSLAGQAWADWLFMMGLLGIGLAVMLGVGLKIAAIAGTLLLAMLYLAVFPVGSANAGFTNPIFDSHWVEALALITFALTRAGDSLGLGKVWGNIVGDGILR